MRTLTAMLLFGCLSGCAHRAIITTDPPGASVRVGGELLGPAPQEVRFWWYPHRPMKVKVSAAGYRSVTIKVGETIGLWYFTRQLFTLHLKRMWGLVPSSTHEVILIRSHGPSGTWTSEDIKP